MRQHDTNLGVKFPTEASFLVQIYFQFGKHIFPHIYASESYIKDTSHM